MVELTRALNNTFSMARTESNGEPKRKYSSISLAKRQKLVDMVEKEGKTVTRAARKLSIKICTARLIVENYRKTGGFPMKKQRRRAQADASPSQSSPHEESAEVQPQAEQPPAGFRVEQAPEQSPNQAQQVPYSVAFVPMPYGYPYCYTMM